jgi:hypothetical protein
MPDSSQYGRTLFISDFKNDTARPLERINFSKRGKESVEYDEAWLQRLIMKRPEVLPVEEIERAFVGLIPVCSELEVVPSRAYVDGFLITPNGDMALVECKLWRNPEARREVVGQIIDYAKDFSAWDSQTLEAAVKRSIGRAGDGMQKARSLYEIACPNGEIEEASFVDTVSRNLSLGRFLLLIVGDGIHEGVGRMTEFLQQYAGLHFTLAMVELALFAFPSGGYIVQPRVLARTTNIDRGIVKVDPAGRITITPSIPAAQRTNAGAATKMAITKERFFEQVDATFPGFSTLDQRFSRAA